MRKLAEFHILTLVTDLLTKYKIEYCLGWGTLLGMIRENDFLQWDREDIDLAVFRPFYLEGLLWEQMVSDLVDVNLRVKDAAYNYVCLVQEHIHVDLHLMEWDELTNSYHVYVTGERQTFPGDIIRPLSQHTWKGRRFSVPYAPEKVLHCLYWDGWKTPNQEDKTHANSIRVDNLEKVTYPYIVSLHKPRR